MKNRSRTDIVTQILEATAQTDDLTKTRLMYKALLSYAQLHEYIPLLIGSDLLQYNQEFHTYRTTENGLKLINLYNKMKKYVKRLED